MNSWIAIGSFIAVLLFFESIYSLWQTKRNPEKKRVRRRLDYLALGAEGTGEVGLERRLLASQVPWLNRFLLKLGWTFRMGLLLEQAGLQKTVGYYLLLSLVFAGCGFLLGSWLTQSSLTALALAAGTGVLPYLQIQWKRKRRMEKFERQLPEALDLMARALKSGHAFTGGLKMVASEMPDPIGTEFDKTLAEINYGIEVPDALKNLSRRVDCPDLRFFVISIIIQRETGGNLAEILENISSLIRERFKLHGRIRVLSAEGKFSALILVALPFLVVGALTLIKPDYIRLLITDPLGHFMIGFSAMMTIVGILVIKGLVAIKV